LTAYGASQASWNANHTPDPAGTGYWPRLPSNVDAYASLTMSGGEVVGYVVNLYPAESLSQAMDSFKEELPPDEQVVGSNSNGGCAQYVLSSAAVRALTGSDVLAVLRSAGAAFNTQAVVSIHYGQISGLPKVFPAC